MYWEFYNIVSQFVQLRAKWIQTDECIWRKRIKIDKIDKSTENKNAHEEDA